MKCALVYCIFIHIATVIVHIATRIVYRVCVVHRAPQKLRRSSTITCIMYGVLCASFIVDNTSYIVLRVPCIAHHALERILPCIGHFLISYKISVYFLKVKFQGVNDTKQGNEENLSSKSP